LTPAVDPYDYGVEGSDSPEAQAFMILMEAAYMDWAVVNVTLGTSKSKSGAMRSGGAGAGWVGWVLGLLSCIGSFVL
jgi:hypothetical protein